MKKGFYHTLLISWKPDASEELKKKTFEMAESLEEACGGADAGILFWKISVNNDQRKNIHWIEFGVFTDEKAFQAYRVHPAHVDFVENYLSKSSDWIVGDFTY